MSGGGTFGFGAVVIGGDYQGLGIVRSLGRRGVPVCVIDDERSIARFSRYTTRSVRVGSLDGDDATAAALVGIGQRLGLSGWVLYPTRDETVTTLARHRSLLAEHFRVPTPEWQSTRWAVDKRRTYELAERLGIPAPRTWYPRSESELAQIEFERPLVVKPATKGPFIKATKAKAWRADTREELCELFARATELTGPGEIMVQELIPGGGEQQFAYCALFKQGRSLASMVVRRRRQHPPDFGRASTFVETVDVPDLDEPSQRFLREIDYYGLVELEYKRDPATGEYKLLDVNARTWGYHTLGEGAGVDFPYLLFADLAGHPVPNRRARPGVRWVRLVTDLPTAVLEIRAGRLGLGSYIRSLRGCDVEAVFTPTDPLPGLVELGLIPYLFAKRGF